MTLNELEWSFLCLILFSCWHVSRLSVVAFRGNCSKTDTDAPLLSAVKRSPVRLVSDNVHFLQIFRGVPWRGGVKQEWGVEFVIYLCLVCRPLYIEFMITIMAGRLEINA